MYNELNLKYFPTTGFRLSEGLVHKRFATDAHAVTFATAFATLRGRTAYHCSVSLLHIESCAESPERSRSREFGFDAMAALRSGGRRRRTGPLRCHAMSVIPFRMPGGLPDVAPQPLRRAARIEPHSTAGRASGRGRQVSGVLTTDSERDSVLRIPEPFPDQRRDPGPGSAVFRERGRAPPQERSLPSGPRERTARVDWAAQDRSHAGTAEHLPSRVLEPTPMSRAGPSVDRERIPMPRRKATKNRHNRHA